MTRLSQNNKALCVGGEETDVNLKFIERDETREREVIKKKTNQQKPNKAEETNGRI